MFRLASPLTPARDARPTAIVRVAEPSTLRCNLPNARRDAAARAVVPQNGLHAAPKELLDAVTAAVEARIAFRDQALDDLVRHLKYLLSHPVLDA